jgi:hypothetical protein
MYRLPEQGGERPEMISNNMGMKSFSCSHITIDVNKNYLLKKWTFKTNPHCFT